MPILAALGFQWGQNFEDAVSRPLRMKVVLSRSLVAIVDRSAAAWICGSRRDLVNVVSRSRLFPITTLV